MSIRKFGFIAGVVMIAMGVLALVPQLSQAPDWLPPLQLNTSYGLFLNFFPMNIMNKLALLAFGIAGILCARATTLTPAITYARAVALTMGILAIFGYIPGFATLYGFWPLFGGEILAHGAFAIAGAYYGYAVPARMERRRTAHDTHAYSR